jgi:hypothetical protein
VVHDQVRDRERIRSFHLQASIDLIGSYVTSDFTSVPAAVAVVPYHRPPVREISHLGHRKLALDRFKDFWRS